jgi:Zinc knuckle
MSYTYTLTVFDEDGNIVVDHDLTPDEAVVILAKAVKNKTVAPIQPPVLTIANRNPTKGMITCKKCGQKGHFAKTCSAQVEPAPKTDAPVRGERCTECHTTGSRHFKTCSRNRKETNPQFVSRETSVPREEPMTEAQYDKLRDDMFNKGFSTLIYSTANKIRPREINVAIRSTDYDDYLASR